MNQILLLLAGSSFFMLPVSRSQNPLNGTRNSVAITHVTNPAIPGKFSVIVGDGWDASAPVIKIVKSI